LHRKIYTAPISASATAYPQLAGLPVLAPRLAASYKITMAIAMGYMLVMML
jgi:hypothetical protein